MLTKLRIQRLKAGLRQIDLATLTGGIVPQHRLSLLERGVKPHPDEVQALARAFQVEASELFQMD
jgi:transcriptional regulator with XRE-family HTH domain